MMMGVSLSIGKGVSTYWWGCICILVGVSIYVGGGVTTY